MHVWLFPLSRGAFGNRLHAMKQADIFSLHVVSVNYEYVKRNRVRHWKARI